MIPLEADVPPPVAPEEVARDAEVRLSGKMCIGCNWLNYGAGGPPPLIPTALRDVFWCEKVLSTNRWREATWPACWHWQSGRWR